ncbi:ATP-binding cassette long-chain fatty acid transporter pxa1 [Stygiomarasmius scandens]|uniref:ATP-binding cassette long-chain fatty acid transporter pxa1 n=1 Tax=Marasmiellus scandens TaxID=2682957 RepID=A0ABR1K4S6_9AGAR
MRTALSIAVARLDGRIVRDLVRADAKAFARGLVLWFALAIPSTYTNVMLKHLQSTLAIRLRTRLTAFIHTLYLSKYPHLRYYRIQQQQGRPPASSDSNDAAEAVQGADQYITADVEAWAEAISGLYGNIMKPSLDLVLFTSQLSRSLGFRGTVLLFSTYWATVRILKAATPAFGAMAAAEARLEGEWRNGVGRIGRESEEVAFYNGGQRERGILGNAYKKLIRHVNSVYKVRIAYEWTEDYVIKYLWSAAGYGLIAVPLLITRSNRSPSSSPSSGNDISLRTETYISNRRLLLSLADAGGRLMYAYKDILELKGVTSRVAGLITELYAVGHNAPEETDENEEQDVIELRNVDVGVPGSGSKKATREYVPPPQSQSRASSMSSSVPVSIRSSHRDSQIFTLEDMEEDVEDYATGEEDLSPEEHLLVRNLTFRLQAGEGEHLMITGSNGVGKTAVARVLAGLWRGLNEGSSSPLELDEDEESGVVIRPKDKDERRKALMVVPQRAYMPAGSLLDQVIYPDSYAQFLERGVGVEKKGDAGEFGWKEAQDEVADEKENVREKEVAPTAGIRKEKNQPTLREILESVYLAYLPEREGGWGTRKEWRDVLSGGEKQRMAMARVFYHRPKFVILDECTSAVSSDVEGRMYEHAKKLGITLITISLRPSLAKYHTQLLTIHGDGTGRWSLEDVNPFNIDSASGLGSGGGGQLSRSGTATELKEIALLERKIKEAEKWEERVKELDGLLRVQEL